MQRRKIAFTICLGLAVVFVFERSPGAISTQESGFESGRSGRAHDDPLIVNAWGLVHTPGSPFWISDNGSGWSTLYDGQGVAGACGSKSRSASGAGPGSATGIVFNGSPEFQVQGWTAFFLFATLDGTISGWAPQSNPNDALIAVDNSASGAVYTGLAITSKPSGNFLYAADNCQ